MPPLPASAGRACLLALSCATTALAQNVPTRVFDAPPLPPAIKSLAAGGADWVAAVLESTDRPTTIWYSGDQGSTSSTPNTSPPRRTPDFVPGHIESRIGISSEGKLCFSADLSPTPRGTYTLYHRFLDSVWFGHAAT